MLLKPLFNPFIPFKSHYPSKLLQYAPFSNLKVHWRKDPSLDKAILTDKKYRLCSRVVKEVLNEPGQIIPLKYLEKRRQRLRLNVRAQTFVNQNPLLFDTFYDRIRPGSELVPFIRPGPELIKFLDEERRIYDQNEGLIVAKLCKMLMMAENRVLNVEKLEHVKREFGFPTGFLTRFVPKYPDYFRVVNGLGGKVFLELVKWDPDLAKSVIIKRAECEERLTGIRARPSFKWELPRGFYIKKEMREWVRDWIEMDYISPYSELGSGYLRSGSREMEKRMVGVIHELLCLSLYKRVPVCILGKFSEDYRFSNSFKSVFTRHSGLFYVSLKGGIETAMLREAYCDGVLVDRDPLVEIKDRFVELLERGWRVRMEELRVRREGVTKDVEGVIDYEG